MFTKFFIYVSYFYYVTIFSLINKIYSTMFLSKNYQSAIYYYCGKKYMIPILIKKGLKPCILKVFDHNQNDITIKIIEFAGPNVDFYNMDITPNKLGYTNLCITTEDETLIFDANDCIKL